MSIGCSANQIESCLAHQKIVIEKIEANTGRISTVETVLRERADRYVADKARAISDHEDLKTLIEKMDANIEGLAEKLREIDATVNKGRFLATFGGTAILVVGGFVGWAIDTFLAWKHA